MIKVGISQCLLGAKVRYDGGHKQNKFCKNQLSSIFEFEPICPEVGIGMPIPRKTLRLIGDPSSPKAVLSENNNVDVTVQLTDYAEKKQQVLSQLSGYIFCKASPSCGVERVKVYNSKNQAEKKGTGIFAAKIQSMFPLLPVEEDGRLNDPLLKDSFIKRVYLYNEWKALQKSGVTTHNLLKFHARHKMTLLAHCQKTYRKLGPILASVTPNTLENISETYIKELMSAFKHPATRSNNTNVLMHLQGFLKHHLSPGDKSELTQCIIDYRKGIQPILAPITLLKHHFKHFPVKYVSKLSYFEPYPKELAIRVTTC